MIPMDTNGVNGNFYVMFGTFKYNKNKFKDIQYNISFSYIQIELFISRLIIDQEKTAQTPQITRSRSPLKVQNYLKLDSRHKNKRYAKSHLGRKHMKTYFNVYS